MSRRNVWSKDFTLITFGTLMSVIGGQVIQLPLSLMVFDQTGSTLLSAVLFIVGMLPSTIIPILVAPVVDRRAKKPLIVGLDYFLAGFYFIFAWILSQTGFNYGLYILAGLILGTVSAVYSTTYNAWYPDLIPKGFEQQGYAVSSTMYPTVTIVMTPVAAFLYKTIPMHWLFVIVGACLVVAATLELWIRETGSLVAQERMSFSEYLEDAKEGLRYVRREHGIRNIYLYMGVTQGISVGNDLMTQAFFQSSAVLTATMLAFLKSAETIGRVLGGLFQYKVVIPPKRRYGLTKLVYLIYETMDMLLLFMPYPLMLVNRFTCGALGMTTATLRQASVQSYLPRNMRAKVNAVFTAYFSVMIIIFQFIMGTLGDLVGYRSVMVVFSGLCLGAIYMFIIRPDAENRTVYEATREALKA